MKRLAEACLLVGHAINATSILSMAIFNSKLLKSPELNLASGWWFQPPEKYSSIGMIIPNMWKQKNMFQTTNQAYPRDADMSTARPMNSPRSPLRNPHGLSATSPAEVVGSKERTGGNARNTKPKAVK